MWISLVSLDEGSLSCHLILGRLKSTITRKLTWSSWTHLRQSTGFGMKTYMGKLSSLGFHRVPVPCACVHVMFPQRESQLRPSQRSYLNRSLWMLAILKILFVNHLTPISNPLLCFSDDTSLCRHRPGSYCSDCITYFQSRTNLSFWLFFNPSETYFTFISI